MLIFIFSWILFSVKLQHESAIYTARYIYTWLYIYVYIHTYIHIYTYIYVCVYTYIYIHIHICTYTYTYIYIYTYTYIHIYIHIYIYTHTHTHIYIHPPFWTSLLFPSHFPSHLGWYRTPVWVSWAIQQIRICYLFYTFIFLPMRNKLKKIAFGQKEARYVTWNNAALLPLWGK